MARKKAVEKVEVVEQDTIEQVEEQEIEQVIEKTQSKIDWSDKEVVLKQVAKDGNNLEYANPKLKSDKEVITLAVKQNCYALSHADSKLRSDKKFILELLDTCNGWLISFIDDKLKQDKAIVKKAIEKDPCAIFYAHESFKEDRSIAIELVKKEGSVLKYLHSFKDDKEIVLLAVKNDFTNFAFKSASDRLKQDEEVIAVKGSKIAGILSRHRFIPIREPKTIEKVSRKAFNPVAKLEEVVAGDETERKAFNPVAKVEEVKVEEVKVSEVKVKKTRKAS
jgi:hypothetical protein